MAQPLESARPTRALFVAADLPWPLDSGGRIATFRDLQAVSRSFEVDLVALADPAGRLEVESLEKLCRQVVVVPQSFTFGRHRVRQTLTAVRSLFSTDPYRLRKFRSRRLHDVMTRLMAESRYDLVHFDQYGVAPYWVAGAATNYACHNVESGIYRLATASTRNPLVRLWAWQEAAKLRRSERRLLPRFDVVVAFSPDDAAALRQLGARSVHVAPMPAPPLSPPRRPPAEPTILSLGSMSWFGVQDGLRWFQREVFPRVRTAVPDVRWRIVGPNAGPAIRRWHGRDGITVDGYVEDLGPVFESARVAIIPLRIAGGVRMKLLDLMAAGVPSVSTRLGARGFDLEDGEGVFRTDEPERFAQAVVDLLTDDRKWTEVTAAGRAYVGRAHSERAFEDAIGSALGEAISAHDLARR